MIDGLVCDYEYDAMGRPTKVATDNIEIDGTTSTLTTSTVYDLGGKKITTTLPSGAVIATEVDALGRTLETTTETGGAPIVETFAYDLDDNAVYQSNGFEATAHAYDAHGRQIASMDLARTKSLAEYDAWGRPKRVETRGSAGAVTGESSFTFTAAGRLQSIDRKVDAAQTRTTTVAWDGGGRTTATATNGRASRRSFDLAGRLQEARAGAGDTTALSTVFSRTTIASHDGALPSLAEQSERTGGAFHASFAYDTLGRATQQSLGALEWRQTFDEAGNVIAAAQPNRPEAQYEYDARGALVAETMPDGAAQRYAYHATGAQTGYTDPASEATSTKTDLIGRPTERIYPDGTRETWTWDGPKLVSTSDRQGRVKTFHYDGNARLIQIMGAGGVALETIEYDEAGRIQRRASLAAAITYGDFDLEGRPRRTTQTRLAPGGTVIDEYTQEHEWNVHGERRGFTMPSYPGMPTAAGWTKRVDLAYDAMGNVASIERTLTIGSSSRLLDTEYRNAGRAGRRTIATSRGASIVRHYGYDETTGLLSELAVTSGGRVAAGSKVTYDGVQKAEAQLLGVSGGARSNLWAYDDRSRLASTIIAKDTGALSDRETLTAADFRLGVDRNPVTPADPPSVAFTELAGGGHKIGEMKKGEATRVFAYNGAERRDDGTFLYDFDDEGQLVRLTEKPPVAPSSLTIRRIRYDYDAGGRMVGRTAEYAQLPAQGVMPDESAWKLEDRADILATDALPASTTFVWDPISDQLVSVFRTGSSRNASIDAHGGLLRQILHGGHGYDDPIEVVVAEGSSVSHLYPLYDEAGAGSLQAIFNADGEMVSRNFTSGAYGEDDFALTGAAADRIAVTASATEVRVEVRLTEEIDAATLAAGARLAAINEAGAVIRLSPAAASLFDNHTIRWSLSSSQWSALTEGAHALSIAVTKNLRAAGWPSNVPVMSAPQWAIETKPVYTSPDLPVEYRESLAALSEWLASIPAGGEKTTTLYEVDSLSALGGAASELVGDPSRLIVSAAFHAYPFVEPASGLVYARNRWYDPSTGTFLTPDPTGYIDSSNLYAGFGGDPVNNRDPRGECFTLAQCAEVWNSTKNFAIGAGQKIERIARAIDASTRENGDPRGRASLNAFTRNVASGTAYELVDVAVTSGDPRYGRTQLERVINKTSATKAEQLVATGLAFLAADQATQQKMIGSGAVDALIALAPFSKGLFSANVAANLADDAISMAPYSGDAWEAFLTQKYGAANVQRDLELIRFKLPAQNQAEFLKHLREQEAVLNALDRDVLIKNLKSYETNRVIGRQAAQEFGIHLPNHAAHALDVIAGGQPLNIIGPRLGAVNSSIGSQWQRRASQIVPGRIHQLKVAE